MSKENKRRHLEHWQVIQIWLILYDIFALNAAFFFALWIRFDGRYSFIPKGYLSAYLSFAPIYTVLAIIVFWQTRLYKSIWRFAGYDELLRMGLATVLTGLIHIIGITFLCERMPLSYYLFGIIIQFILTVGVRFSYRFVLLERSKRGSEDTKQRVMIIGAGRAGQAILREITGADEISMKVCCIIDDNSNKWNRYIENVPIVGGRDDIMLNVKKYQVQKIFVALPSASMEQKREILNICKETGCELKILPGVYQIINGEVSLQKLKDVSVEDLLGREPIKVDMGEIFESIQGKTILVTGGGGSIGSEICRQIARHQPGHLIIFDIYENNAYDIEQELRYEMPELHLTVLIGSVRDRNRIDSIFETYHPDFVYHAAAHKHVPLMEGSPCEAIKNNVIGTYKTACAAIHNGCQRFVLISTDKAVNPTNIMGASKRLCEMVIQSMDAISRQNRLDKLPLLSAHYKDEEMTKQYSFSKRTEFVAVRFGNVLGSNGSVIPLFEKQIAKGGPVTVTHPDIIRYFMTIPEAVSLVLQAGTYARGGEVFVLDMGAPVKIDTLARNLIKLSLLDPDIDIPLVYTGLRPGEKLYEEKLMLEEGMKKTRNKLIHIGKPIPFDIDRFLEQLNHLADVCYKNDENIYDLVAEMVPTYHREDQNLKERNEVYEELMAETAATQEN